MISFLFSMAGLLNLLFNELAKLSDYDWVFADDLRVRSYEECQKRRRDKKADRNCINNINTEDEQAGHQGRSANSSDIRCGG